MLSTLSPASDETRSLFGANSQLRKLQLWAFARWGAGRVGASAIVASTPPTAVQVTDESR